METFAQNLMQLHVSLAACDAPDEDYPALQRHRLKAGREVWTSIEIKHHVESAATRHVFGKNRKF